jgi:hypothetical protein
VQHIIRCRSSESINCGASLEEAWLSRDLNQWLLVMLAAILILRMSLRSCGLCDSRHFMTFSQAPRSLFILSHFSNNLYLVVLVVGYNASLVSADRGPASSKLKCKISTWQRFSNGQTQKTFNNSP